MTFENYSLDELKTAFMNSSNIKIVKLYNSDGDLVRVISDYDFYDIQIKPLDGSEHIIVNLSEGDMLEKTVATLQKKIENIDVPIEEDMDMMTLLELKNYKKSILQSKCRKTIYAGENVDTAPYGSQHFSYTQDDQRNIESLFSIALITKLEQPYHADGETCAIYGVKDIVNIYMTLQKFKLYHTTLINAYNRYIEDISDIDLLKGLDYPSSYEKFPQFYKDSADAAIAQGNSVISAMASLYKI